MKDPRNSQRAGAPASRPADSADDDTSDLVDLQAIAASTRASATRPVMNPAELSGVLARRDSVVGARVAGTGTGIPPFVWGLIGCLGVVAVGLALFSYLVPRGLLAPEATTAAPAPPASLPTPSSSASGPRIVQLPARTVEPPPAPATAAQFASTHADHADKERAAHRAGSAAGKSVTRALVAPPADGEETAAPAVQSPAAPAKPDVLDKILGSNAGAGPSDPRKEVNAALDDLQPKVHECFRRFQIRGVAQVRLTVSPDGSVESPTLTGDFDGTPTGDCVLKELASAALPPFKGSPVSVSHAYVFR